MGDADGLAWNVTVSIMDFVPKHSIGINYAGTDAGWLVSPEYRNNERLTEIRYMWRPNDRMTVDIRARPARGLAAEDHRGTRTGMVSISSCDSRGPSSCGG